jgi:transglutaminase-like putative cysteine protease
MRFIVHHETLYRYSAPVRFAPHLLRLNPRAEGVRLLSRELTVTPQPAECLEVVDAYGNRITRAVFDQSSDQLRIASRFELDTFARAPDSIDALPQLPWPQAGADDLGSYRESSGGGDSVHDFATIVAAEASYAPGAFLDVLTRTLSTTIDRRIRIEGAAQPPDVTLATRRGACRDISVLFLAVCRSQGMASRFVSGYQARSQTPDGERHLHAWAEVFLPGLGWAGWDPTHGLRVTDGHVALCAAPDQSATMPVEGGFFGFAETATLDCSVRITTQ